MGLPALDQLPGALGIGPHVGAQAPLNRTGPAHVRLKGGIDAHPFGGKDPNDPLQARGELVQALDQQVAEPPA
ncbi:hypothetical protein D3C86_1697190 [compost metagenome]